jgi:hypothetical protein
MLTILDRQLALLAQVGALREAQPRQPPGADAPAQDGRSQAPLLPGSSIPIQPALGTLEVELVDADGQPVVGEPVVAMLHDGTIRTVLTDARGRARFEGLVRGAYRVCFPWAQVGRA